MAPKIRRKASPDLPSLFPTHDGSYGINTFINIESEAKKGNKQNNGIAKEQSDDNDWVDSMKSKVARNYGMSSNLRKAITESHEQVEKEHRDQESTSQNASHVSNENISGFSESSESSEIVTTPSSSETSEFSRPPPKADGLGKDLKTSDGTNTKLTPHIPHYNPTNPPFSEEYHDQSQLPHTRSEVPSYNPYAPSGVNRLTSPPSENIPFYGIPHGKGSMQPISPMGPDSPKSFDDESRLYADAILQTPIQTTNLFDTSTNTNRGLGLVQKDQPSGWFDFRKVFRAGAQLTTPPDSGKEIQRGEKDQPSGWFDLTKVFRAGAQLTTPPDSGKEIHREGQITTGQSVTEPKKVAGQSIPAPTFTNEQSAPLSTQDIRQPPEPPKMLRGPKVPNPKKIFEAVTSKQGSRYRGQQPNKKPLPRNTSVSERISSVDPIDQDNEDAWTRPSSDLVITSIVMFSVLAFAAWTAISAALSAIPGDINGIDTDISRVNYGLPTFGIGTMWGKISSLLPELPDLDNVSHDKLREKPTSPKPSNNADIDYENLIAKLKDVMPDWVWVQRYENGKIEIPEDFWHALKEMNKGDSISDLSDDLWGAIKSRLHADDFIGKKISQAWESWLKQNNHALEKASTGATLTKDEFMKLFKQEAASSQREIKEELAVLQDRVKKLTQRVSSMQDEAGAGSTVSADEIKEAVDAMVLKAVTNAKLDAIAQGRIKGHANDVLANQVNLFALGAGAVIDPALTSLAWKAPRAPMDSNKRLSRDGQQVQPPMAALSPWTQEGECYCAAPDRRGYGQGTNNISVILSRNIIPQHLVVEHILPGATLNPGAMPREIEAWAYIEEINLRNELRAFSETRFPDTPREQILNDGFVKIGHFTYENRNSGDGVQVFKMSDELSRMQAVTNHMVVRAINNYGADHTCFYRIKMYGGLIKRPDDPQRDGRPRRPWSWSWPWS
ncbi:hypothetical protein GGS21DRAFT_492662 [Xylaria nigripes]|nr:hypothetical protein GGS21DRAFT_492662 [Xylaria nigripes]